MYVYSYSYLIYSAEPHLLCILKESYASRYVLWMFGIDIYIDTIE